MKKKLFLYNLRLLICVNTSKGLWGECIKRNAQCFPRHTGRCAWRLWRSFLLLAIYMEKPKEYWRPLRQYLQISRDMLGNAQVKVEICWAHISRRLRKDENSARKSCLLIAKKKSRLAYWAPSNFINQVFSPFLWSAAVLLNSIKDVTEESSKPLASPIFALTNPFALNKTQTFATVLLKG